MSKNRTHVVLVSDQVLPIVLPAMDYNLKPDKVILCENNEMLKRGVGKRLAGFFKANNIKSEFFKLGNVDDFTKLHKKLGELASRLGSNSSDVIVNLCGGSGYVPVAVQNVFAAKNMTCIYIQPQRNEMIAMRGGKIKHYQLQDKLKLNDYFRIHGCQVLSKREKNLKLMSGSHALCRELLSDFGKYAKYISYLDRLAIGAENHFSLKAKAKITQDNKPVFKLFQKHGFISSFDEKMVKFVGEDDRAFCKGIWLEDYLHQTLKNISKDAGLQDFATCVKFDNASGVRYELDAAFLYKNRLYVIEANSSRVSERGGDDLFKFESLWDFDAACVVPIVVSFHDLRNLDLKRASRQGIHLIQSSEINEIEKKIRALLH